MILFSDLLRPRRYFALRAKKKKKKREFGMTSWHEQHWLRTYAARTYQGRGTIVDLGCFVGATTISLAEGLALNSRAEQKQIHAYDLFAWSEDFELWAKGKGIEAQFDVDGSFLPEFLKRTAPWRQYIVVHEEDLTQSQWQHGPIEFLLIDAMKTAATANAIVHSFFPHLLPGISYVAHQDFAHCYTPWIHLIAFRLRDYFSPVADVPASGTTVFRYEKELPGSATDMNVAFTACAAEEIESAFDHSLSLVPEEKRGNIIAAKAMAYRERGDIARAREVLAETNGVNSLANELELVKSFIVEKSK
jgi:hypothetical protein